VTEEMAITGGPNVFLKDGYTFFVHRDTLSDEVSEWVINNLDLTSFVYESHTSEHSPFESYTFFRAQDFILFKLFWFGR
jgi:hypothetical protein